jgi:ABC-type glycerol-3-phosphate transport system substrate-binding protein
MKRCFVVFVALCFCAALAFAGGGGQSSGASGGLTTIKMTQAGSLPAGIQSGFHWTETLAKDLGVQLDIVVSSADALQAMIAARDLPEFISINSQPHIADIVRARLVQDLEPHKARLPNVFKWTGMIQYMKDNWSDGQGKVYAVRGSTGNRGDTTGTGAGPYVRWDYYKELGYPEITDLEGYLPVLKAMQDRHPVNDAGQKVYAMSLFSDWDGNRMALGNVFSNIVGKMSPGGYLEVDIETNAVNSMLDDNSAYKRNLKFFYNANKLGILDPDSPTQGYEIWREKGAAGRHILSWWWWGNDNLLNATELAAQGKARALCFSPSRI